MRQSRWRLVCLSASLGMLLVGLTASALVHLPAFDSPLSTVLYDRDGQLLSATVASDEQWRFAPPAALPEKFVHALLTFEDKRFFTHPGIDPLAVGRALLDSIQAGHVVSGASTLTMQVARLARPGSARSLTNKVIEALGALKLEAAYSKEDILALYATHAPFGGNVVGLEAAAWRYFARSPHHLSWAESATLAVLPNSPALIHPGRNRSQLEAKRNALLRRLGAQGLLDAETLELSIAEPLPGRPHKIPNLAPHLASHHRSQDPGERVETTLRSSLQTMTTEVVLRHHRSLSGNGIHNAAAIILDVKSGQVLAYVGNVPLFSPALHHNHVDIIQSERSTGSVLKPLLYSAMLRDGALMPDQLIADIPTRVGGFAPMNFGRSYDGAVPASQALARSLNVPAVRMLHHSGLDRFYAELESLGISSLHRPSSHYGLSLILGGSEASLWELTGIYAGLARATESGTVQALSKDAFRPHYLARQAQGHETPTTAGQYQADPAVLYQTMHALLEVNRPGLSRGWRQFASTRPIAWKTGTSYGFRDAWAVGVTPEYAVGVWVGNADGEGRAGLTGTLAAAPIMLDIFSRLGPTTWFRPPATGMKMVSVCSRSGHVAGPHCTSTDMRHTPKSAAGSESCGYCQRIHLHETEALRVSSACSPVHRMRTQSHFSLPTTQEWFYRRKHPRYQPLPDYHPTCPESRDDQRPKMAILYPQPN
ncbi:MAG: penicillin-binding protein 1C, partial [Myxococcota bacterium]|nr:penicillin-binding protein 1C [Myxococcota bacterium]